MSTTTVPARAIRMTTADPVGAIQAPGGADQAIALAASPYSFEQGGAPG